MAPIDVTPSQAVDHLEELAQIVKDHRRELTPEECTRLQDIGSSVLFTGTAGGYTNG